MPKKSAGILLYRLYSNLPQVLLVHPGGPYWAGKDLGAWSIPKGEFWDDEDAIDAAKREFEEETGMGIAGDFIELNPVKQKSGKTVYAWAVEGDINPEEIISNTFEIEWPPKSGMKKTFPEIDQALWFTLDEAKIKILEAQMPLINELETKLDAVK
jgi:predicted NUDIX family NTP pyrophosphohydrolase